MSDPVHVPFTRDQVESLNAYQGSGRMHPFTCGTGHDTNRVLFATEQGWRCRTEWCQYWQGWAHRWMADWSWNAKEEKHHDG